MIADAAVPQSTFDLIPDAAVPSSSGTTRGENDGRVALRLRNRQRVIDALIELVDDGDISPSMDAIVLRSGVSERSIFRYFTDLADLSISAVRAVVERAEPLHVIEDMGEGTLDHRIDEMIAARLRVARRTHAFGTLARRKLALTAEIQQALRNVIVMLRFQFSRQFAPELGAMSDDEATMVTDTLTALFSYEGLDVMWHQLDNDHEAVAERWRMVMTLLLTPRS
ncbi:MAG: TetR/AcrR family transcriptional regulator [Ilumatobacter sp.]|uniref:TetR/AcrR family transcriptional regulator n=1 Tax=Ilumatobacter sp. TaxID=1967498 RepID=UPI003C71499B